jgi:5-methylcytosine-specific restriction endonuclease McrA
MTYGFGSIYQRSRDGIWVASVDLPRSRGEQRRRKTFTSTRREVALAKLVAYREEHPPQLYRGRDAYLQDARQQGTHTDAQWWALVRAAERICFYCGTETNCDLEATGDPRQVQRDHLVPLSRGGSDHIDNIVVSCRSCNLDKGTMTAGEFLNWKAAQRG